MPHLVHFPRCQELSFARALGPLAASDNVSGASAKSLNAAALFAYQNEQDHGKTVGKPWENHGFPMKIITGYFMGNIMEYGDEKCIENQSLGQWTGWVGRDTRPGKHSQLANLKMAQLKQWVFPWKNDDFPVRNM